MTTHDTRSQLLAEIAANPEDDTLRLAFADWLDEQPAGRKACPLDFCRGGYWRHSGDPHTRSTRCHVCGPDGTVPDAADRDRAEFVRVQCDLAGPLKDACGCGACPSSLPHGPDCLRSYSLSVRQGKLLSTHPEWSRCRCPECDGSGDQGKKNGHDGLACPACGGTGDLFLTPRVSGASLTPPPKPRTVTFARGFVDGVTCTLAEAFAPDGTPTPWAVEVVKQTPVVRFWLTDLEPYHRDAAIRGPFAVGLVWDWSSAHVPKVLMAEMAAAHHDKIAGDMRDAVWWLEFDTRDAAADALALAAGRLVRRHAHRERK